MSDKAILQVFNKAVELRDSAINALIGADEDARMRQLQGEAQAYQIIIDFIEKDGNSG